MINFIVGIIFASLILPLIDRLTDLLCTAMNVWISRMNVDIQQSSADINDIVNGTAPISTNLIGFNADFPKDEDFEYDDE